MDVSSRKKEQVKGIKKFQGKRRMARGEGMHKLAVNPFRQKEDINARTPAKRGKRFVNKKHQRPTIHHLLP